ncbi:MAG: kelch repeat-containing protein [bacterium]
MKYLALLLVAALGCSDDSSTPQTTADAGQDVSQADTGTSDTSQADAGADMNTTPAWSYPGEIVACQTNTSYEAQRAILAGGKNNPTGRGEQSGVWDPCNSRIILFGGNDQQPAQCANFGPKNYLGDTWAYSEEFENWYRVNTTNAPNARGRAASAFDPLRKQVIIFGGKYRNPDSTGLYQMFQDTWAFDVNTDTWTQLATTGEVPSARANAAMVFDAARDRLLLFGGSTNPDGAFFTPTADLYSLDMKTLTWKREATTNPPTKRLFHAMTIDTTNNRLLIFSGGDENAFFGPFYADLWAAPLDNFRFEKVWDGANILGPKARINAVLVDDPQHQRVLLFGGHDDTALGNVNDVWAVFGDNAWQNMREGDVYTGAGCPSFCQCADTFVTYDFDSPERREYHTLVNDGKGDLILFGGTGDCGYMDDTWRFDLDTATWTEVHAAEQGIACARTGRDNCEELCF